jgi:hypothetical protein
MSSARATVRLGSAMLRRAACDSSDLSNASGLRIRCFDGRAPRRARIAPWPQPVLLLAHTELVRPKRPKREWRQKALPLQSSVSGSERPFIEPARLTQENGLTLHEFDKRSDIGTGQGQIRWSESIGHDHAFDAHRNPAA